MLDPFHHTFAHKALCYLEIRIGKANPHLLLFSSIVLIIATKRLILVKRTSEGNRVALLTFEA